MERMDLSFYTFITSKILKNPMFQQVSGQAVSETTNNKRAVMFFVIPPGHTRNSCRTRGIGRMAQLAETHKLLIRWITDSESIHQVIEGDGNIFVFDDFDEVNPGFKFWNKEINKIPFRVQLLGPQVLRHVFNSQDTLKFETGGYPTYSLAMRGMTIVLSGFEEKEMDTEHDELAQLVKWMNGSVSPDFTDEVTHVVSQNAATPEAAEARNSGVPVMTEEWIQKVWLQNKTSAVDASDRRYVELISPLFYNLEISLCRSLPESGRQTIRDTIKRLGGLVKTDLMLRPGIDVFVASQPEGEKYTLAQMLNIPCVTQEWVEDSADLGCIQAYEDYLPTGNKVTTDEDDEDELEDSTVSRDSDDETNAVENAAPTGGTSEQDIIVQPQPPASEPGPSRCLRKRLRKDD